MRKKKAETKRQSVVFVLWWPCLPQGTSLMRCTKLHVGFDEGCDLCVPAFVGGVAG